MATQVGYGSQQRAIHVRIPDAGPTFPRSPVDVLPSPWDHLGPLIRGCGQPGPPGEQEA